MESTWPVSLKKATELIQSVKSWCTESFSTKHSHPYAPSSHVGDSTHLTSTEKSLLSNMLNNIYPVGIVVWCKNTAACPKIGTWTVCSALVGRYPLGDSTGGLTTVAAGLPGIALALRIDHSSKEYYGTTYSAYGTDDKGGVVSESTSSEDEAMCNMLSAEKANRAGDLIPAVEGIYGNSTTVTPPSAKLIPYIRTA